MCNIVGQGVYRGIQWEITRNEQNLCAVSVTSIFPLTDTHSEQFMLCNWVKSKLYQKSENIYTTNFLFKRKDGREVARILSLSLWHIYDKYNYK